jgi:hypothetical protein
MTVDASAGTRVTIEFVDGDARPPAGPRMLEEQLNV